MRGKAGGPYGLTEGHPGERGKRCKEGVNFLKMCRCQSALGGFCVLQAQGRGWKLLDLCLLSSTAPAAFDLGPRPAPHALRARDSWH